MGKIIARVREREKAAAAVRMAEWTALYELQRLQTMIDGHDASYFEAMRVRVAQEESENNLWWVWPK